MVVMASREHPCLPSGARLPHVATCAHAQDWLRLLANLGRAERTLDAYARGLDQYLAFCTMRGVEPERATLECVSLFVRWQRGDEYEGIVRSTAVANATLLQRLTAVRLWYDHLVYQGVRDRNPVPRSDRLAHVTGTHPRTGVGRALVAKVEQLPRIPTDEVWQRIIATASSETLRNRVMFALAYFGALRREELVRLEVEDVDYARRLITVRADTTKTGRGRVVTYSATAALNLVLYLRERHAIDRRPGALFLSSSNRNAGAPLSKWQWSKTVQAIARRADAAHFSTHTFRHLRLTHLARAGWGLHEIASYAGHTNPQSTMVYLHLSGTELAGKIARTLATRDEVLDGVLFGS